MFLTDVRLGFKYAYGNNRKYQCLKFPTFEQMYFLLAGGKDMFSEAASEKSTKIMFVKIIEA